MYSRSRRRPSWTYYPEDFRWRDARWGDRVRVVLVVAGVIAILLAGASDLRIP